MQETFVILQKIKKLFNILQSTYYISALIKGVAAATEHESILTELSFSTIIDIGANRGQFSLIARKLCPQSNIYSFEPLNEPASKYLDIFKNDSKTNLFIQAVGPRSEILDIHVSKRDDSSSLLPITISQTELFPGTEERAIKKVKVSPLDKILTEDKLQKPVLLKIDVQGYELETLRGCDQLLNKIQHIYVECSFLELYKGQALAFEIIDFMSERLFYLAGIFNVTFDRKGMPVQADFLFKREETE